MRVTKAMLEERLRIAARDAKEHKRNARVAMGFAFAFGFAVSWIVWSL